MKSYICDINMMWNVKESYVMNRYLIKTTEGCLKIVYGSYLKAVKQSAKGSQIKIIPDSISEDVIRYGRVSFVDL